MVDVEYCLPKGVNGLPESVVVKVPTAVPCKKIKKGDELVLHMPAKQKGEKPRSCCQSCRSLPRRSRGQSTEGLRN